MLTLNEELVFVRGMQSDISHEEEIVDHIVKFFDEDLYPGGRSEIKNEIFVEHIFSLSDRTNL
jgi:hypothetical protein